MSTGPLNSAAPTTATLIGGVYNVTSPAPAAGQESALQIDASGNLLVNIAAGGGAGGVQYADGATQATPTGTVALAKNPSNILHALGLSAAGNLNVNLAEGTISGGNAAASATGAAVPASADYVGFSQSGTLVGVDQSNRFPVTDAADDVVSADANSFITKIGGILAGGTSAQPCHISAAGNLNVNLAEGSISGGNAAAGLTGAAVPTSADYTGFNSGGNLVGVSTSNPLPVSQQGSVAVTGTFFQATQPVSIAAAVDVSDRAARLLGVVYGSQAQQLKQTATNFNLQTELATGGTLYDARQIRALTSADVVSAAQATAANLNATVVFGSPQHVVVDSGSISATQGTSPWVENLTQVGGSAISLGIKTSANSIPVVLASDQSTINVLVQNAFVGTLDGADGLTGAAVPSYASFIGFSSGGNTTAVSSATPLPVSQQGAVDVSDRSARLLGVVSAASLPLPLNAAQETGGNLASILSQATLVVSNTRSDAQIVDLLAQILSQAKYHNMLLASSSTADMDDADTIASTLIQ